MVERLFLNRVNAEAGGTAITGQYNAAFAGLTDKTKAALACSQFAKAGTQVALNTAIGQAMPPLALYNTRLNFGPA
jgi:hypothetical protein